MKLTLFPVLIALLWAGCDESTSDSIKFEGDGGVPIPIRLSALTPETDVTLEVHPYDGNFIVDTGAPLNLVDTGHYTFEKGYHKVDATALGLFFPKLPMVFENIFDDSLSVYGIIGSELLSSFNWEINYRDNYMVLHTGDLPSNLENGHPISFSMLGGGRYRLSDGSTIDVGKTRYIVSIDIEGEAADSLLDTGASYLVLSDTFLASLPDIERVSHGTTQIVTVYGIINAPLIEVQFMAFSDSPEDSKVESVLTVVVEDDFFDELRLETGRHVKALLGGSYMQYFHMRFNMSQRIFWIDDPSLGKNRKKLEGIVRWPLPLEPKL